MALTFFKTHFLPFVLAVFVTSFSFSFSGAKSALQEIEELDLYLSKSPYVGFADSVLVFDDQHDNYIRLVSATIEKITKCEVRTPIFFLFQGEEKLSVSPLRNDKLEPLAPRTILPLDRPIKIENLYVKIPDDFVDEEKYLISAFIKCSKLADNYRTYQIGLDYRVEAINKTIELIRE